jgi:hypothetical protein
MMMKIVILDGVNCVLNVIEVGDMAESGYKSISRIDIPKKKTHGWQVRVWFKGKRHTKFFNDKWYGSREKSLQASVAYRDELEKELGKPRCDGVVVTHSSRNKTGVVGVSRIRRKTGTVSATGEPNYSEVYEVTWQDENKKIRRRRYSIAKYGEEEAFHLACNWRREQEQKRYGCELSLPSQIETEQNGPVVIKRIKQRPRTGRPTPQNEFYEVTWRPSVDVLWRKVVSIGEFGEEEAYRRACNIKQRKEREIQD